MTRPANLLLFLSNRCNMECDYCFLDLNRGPAVVLDRKAARAALKDHWSGLPAGQARVTFLGGEPLVHWTLLEGLLEFCREESPRGTRVNVVTNGTLLSSARLERLAGLDVSVTVSIDGEAETNDRHRRLSGGRDGSAYGKALGSIPPARRSGLRANLVVCRDTAGRLLTSVEHVRRAGFSKLSFHLNIQEDWTPDGLRTLESVLDGFGRYWRTLSASSPGSLELTHLASFGGEDGPEPEGHAYDDLVLGADGGYYPCDAFFARPFAALREWGVGDALSGVDWRKREAIHRRAGEAIHRYLGGARHYTCPRETYFHALSAGRDPEKAVQSYHYADEVLGAALGSLAALDAPIPAGGERA